MNTRNIIPGKLSMQPTERGGGCTVILEKSDLLHLRQNETIFNLKTSHMAPQASFFLGPIAGSRFT